jgi:GAF domain-containing protein
MPNAPRSRRAMRTGGACPSGEKGAVVVADPPFDLLPRMTRLVCRAVSGVDDCGITVRHAGQAITVAFSSDLAALNDELQYTSEAGPCLQALGDGAMVESHDLTSETRWGRYAAAAVGCGVRSILSLPIDAADAGQGVLNLYSQTAHGFSEEDRQACAEFADMIADVVIASAHLTNDTAMAQRIRQGVIHRSQVAQAVGVYMARHRCGPEEAFQLLLLTSREHREDIYTTAARIGGLTDP